MRVNELIEYLQKLPQDLTVLYHDVYCDADDGISEVQHVFDKNGEFIRLTGGYPYKN